MASQNFKGYGCNDVGLHRRICSCENRTVVREISYYLPRSFWSVRDKVSGHSSQARSQIRRGWKSCDCGWSLVRHGSRAAGGRTLLWSRGREANCLQHGIPGARLDERGLERSLRQRTCLNRRTSTLSSVWNGCRSSHCPKVDV